MVLPASRTINVRTEASPVAAVVPNAIGAFTNKYVIVFYLVSFIGVNYSSNFVKKIMRYVAFLRGINVGGHKIIKMPELTEIFLSFGLENVKTLLQSGNVLFDWSKATNTSVVKKLETGLLKKLGYEVKVLVRTIPEVEAILHANPFGTIKEGSDIKLYVTFLPEPAKEQPVLPYVSKKDGFEIIAITGQEIYTVAHRLPDGRYGSLGYIEKTFGKYSTTRNWNTVMKLV